MPPPAARTDLLALLDRIGVSHHTVEHPAIFTVEEGRDLKAAMPGGHSKNLFLKDKAGALYLAVALGDTKVDLIGLGKRLGAKGRLSFGRPELMIATLGVIPGAVTPFTLINETARTLSRVIIDDAILAQNPIWFHPLENTASTAVSPPDFMKFLAAVGVDPLIVDLARPNAA